jgi:hypothetical protein
VLQAGDKRLLGELALPLAAVSRAALQLEAQGFVELLGQGAALAAATEATAGQLQAEYYRLLAQQAQLQAAHVSQLGIGAGERVGKSLSAEVVVQLQAAHVSQLGAGGGARGGPAGHP